MEAVTQKYWFTYHFYWLNPKSGHLVPVGGSFCKEGARNLFEHFTMIGTKIEKVEVRMISGQPVFDWNNVVNTRNLKLK